MALVFWMCALLAGQSDTLLNRIRQKMAGNLARLPNYTCEQTIERSLRPASSRKFLPVDTIRLEVAFVGGKELYSWPGETKFEDRTIDEVVGNGAIGSGDFALHAHTLFQTSAPVFTGEGKESGALRYDFRVPRSAAKYVLKSGTTRAVLGYYGSFWVDAQSLDLERIEIVADEIPPELETARVHDVMRYGRERIGEADFLLPQSYELTMVDRAGNENRNRAQFRACRQYTGSSVISFAEPAVAPDAPRTIRELRLPGKLAVDIALDTEIRSEHLAIGDPVSGTVWRDARRGGEVVIPKGAVLKGRITRVVHRTPRSGEQHALGIEFDTLEFADRRAEFRAVLEDVRLAGRQVFVANARNNSLEAPHPGEGIFAFKGPFRLPAGLQMVWRTLPY